MTALVVVHSLGVVPVTTASVPVEVAQPATSSELEVLRRQIAGLEQSLHALAARCKDLAGQLAALELELRLQDRRVAEAVEERRLAEAAAAELAASVMALEQNLKGARESLRRRVGGLYRLGRQGYLRLLLAAGPDAEPLAALRTVRFLARRDHDVIHLYEQLRRDLGQRQELLAVRQRQASTWAEQERLRAARLVAARREHQSLMAQAERERLEVAARAVDLADREQRLSALLQQLSQGGATPLSGVAIQDFRGALEWPVDGRVAIGFGPRTDPRYGTAVPHRGIEVETTRGQSARAIYPGKVVYAAELEGYGETVVIQHAGRVFSLYSGLVSLESKRGDMVSLGAVLGTSESRLYFEIRVENRPEDPLDWLRPARK